MLAKSDLQASNLQAKFQRYAQAQVARVLTQMDRDPDSPTFGCFDRNYWHYKIRDFPSAILQQGLFTLEAVRNGSLQETVTTSVIERWCVGAVNALARQVDRQGGVDEYYPFERSYPAAAFGLYGVCRVLCDWQAIAPHLLTTIDWQPLKRLAHHLAARIEQQASNQQAAGLAGLALAARLPALGIDPAIAQRHATRLFDSQQPEGWFDEYGGPDFGYLSVTLDALADYYDVTQDSRALEVSDRAIHFLAQLVGADGRLPSTLNSRNTDYVVPYGLVRAAARNPLAAWLVETLFQEVDHPTHFLWATDDRYHCHYIFASLVRSLPYLAQMQPAQAPAVQRSTWLSGCGFWIYRSPDQTWTAYVAARKGGLVRIHRRADSAIADYGWRIQSDKTIWTSNWWSDHWSITYDKDTIRIQGRCQQAKFHVPTPFKHAVLRILAGLFGDKLIPFLKQKMIFRKGKADGPEFERVVEVNAQGLQIRDRLGVMNGAIAVPSPRQNLRHVASADSFCREEWQPSLLGDTSQCLDQERIVTVNWHPHAKGDV